MLFASAHDLIGSSTAGEPQLAIHLPFLPPCIRVHFTTIASSIQQSFGGDIPFLGITSDTKRASGRATFRRQRKDYDTAKRIQLLLHSLTAAKQWEGIMSIGVQR
jgi:hypothetical protein